MQSTVRLILILLVVALIFNNYSSLKILNFTIDALQYDLEQRAALVTREVSRQVANEDTAKRSIEIFLRSRMDTYSIQAIAVYDSSYRPAARIANALSEEAIRWLDHPTEALRRGERVRMDKYLFIPASYGPKKILVAVFDAEKIVRIERSTKMITYLNFLLMGFAGLLGFYFLESVLRPYRLLLQTARSAPASFRSEDSRNEADFVISTFRSVITRLKEKEQELAKMHLAEKARADDVEQLNQDLLRSISSGLILIDQFRMIRVFNDAAAKILQVPATNIVDQPYEKVIGQISLAFKEDIDKCFDQRANLNRAEMQIRISQGDLRFIGANIMPLQDRQQNFAGVFCIFTDITEFKLLQQHMALKEKFASLGEMAAGVAHEFRNSVATITGYLQLLDKSVDVEQKNYTDPIAKELQELQKVVNAFLSFARPVQLQLSRVHLGELLRDCIEEVKVSAMGSTVEFSMHGKFPVVTADETALRQVFSNLLRNAVESIDGSGRAGVIEVTSPTARQGKLAAVEIRDNGIGIPPEDLSRIFTPFFSTKEKGVGLGLAIVQKMILQHNGSISVESNPKGSVFRVQLPSE